MAKKSRRPVRGEQAADRAASSVATRPQTAIPSPSTTRRARPRRARQESIFERYRTLIITGAAAAGVLIIGFLFFQGSTRAAYECATIMTPGPVESVTPRPSFLVTPSPTASPASPASPAPSVGVSPAASPGASPGTSPVSSPAATPGASPATSPGASPEISPSAEPSPSASPSPAPDPTARLGFTTTIPGREHVRDPNQTIRYGYCPPTSGDHINAVGRGPIAQRVYEPGEGEKPPGGWVHNLEHGNIVVVYRCPSPEDCPSSAELAELRQFFEQVPGNDPRCQKEVVVARFDSMDTRFAILAWGRALLMNDFDLDTALLFAQQWMNHAGAPEVTSC